MATRDKWNVLYLHEIKECVIIDNEELEAEPLKPDSESLIGSNLSKSEAREVARKKEQEEEE